MRRTFHDSALEDRFRAEGYVVVPFLDAAQLDHLTRLYAETASGVGTGFYSSLWSEDIAYRERVHREVMRIIKPSTDRLLHDYREVLGNFVVKHPGREDSKVPVHQDWSMIDEPEHLPVALWCPLVDVTPENGCLAVVPGSHRLVECIRPNQPHGLGFSPFRDLHQKIERDLLHPLPVVAGQAVVYSPALLHGSQVNRSPVSRVAAVAVYVPREAPLRHFFQQLPDEIEVYDVDDDFYWKKVTLAVRPDDVTLVARVPATNQALSEPQFEALLQRVRA